MLDRDLAILYDVETKYLKRQVKRNIGRFPQDFMFVVTKEAFINLRSQFGTSSWRGTRYLPTTPLLKRLRADNSKKQFLNNIRFQ